jgi:hypothetical protein
LAKVAMMFAASAVATSVGVSMGLGEQRTPDLTAPQVSVIYPKDARVTLWGGVFAEEDHRVSGFNAVYDDAINPKLTYLGCRFDVVAVSPSANWDAASTALSKIVDRDTPTSVYGWLKNPRRNSLVDPTTDVRCSDSRSYFFFTYRTAVGLFNNYGYTYVVLEVPSSNDPLVDASGWIGSETPSRQAYNLIQHSDQVFKVEFMPPENRDRAEQEDRAVIDFLFEHAPAILAWLA